MAFPREGPDLACPESVEHKNPGQGYEGPEGHYGEDENNIERQVARPTRVRDLGDVDQFSIEFPGDFEGGGHNRVVYYSVAVENRKERTSGAGPELWVFWTDCRERECPGDRRRSIVRIETRPTLIARMITTWQAV